ncbi:MAG: nodulation protein NfeD [Pseudomonadota bacterium]|nr:nodulation protein NfeD [Pseudomonadota bacterium]
MTLHARMLLAILLLLVPGWVGSQEPATVAGEGRVMLLDIQGGIGPATRDYLQRSLARAAEENAAAVVLRIDTPGGLDAATRDINRDILASQVPVITWVAPQGARAASAGTYIVYASHLAAMAPATSLGAATPVALGGKGADPGDAGTRRRGSPGGADDGASAERQGTDPDEGPPAGREAEPPGSPQQGGDAMSRKTINDSVSYLRSLADLRGRNAGFAEAAVRDAATLTATQALDRGVVEIMADDLSSLLRQADGRVVQLRTGPIVLDTADREVDTVSPDWRSRLLSVITEPTVAYLLLLVGLYGLLLEGYSPGAIVPGVVGGISLLLALYALQVLPVNYAGVALIVLGVVLMVAEIAAPSFGALGIGGVVALLAGSLMLFDRQVPGFAIPLQLIGGIGLASALAFMGVVYLAARARKRPVTTGIDELISHMATAMRDFQGHGHVRIRGEVWQANSDAAVHEGEHVRVLGIDGLTLLVVPLRSAETPPQRASTSADQPGNRRARNSDNGAEP